MVGIVIAVAVGLFLKEQKHLTRSFIVSIIVYAICEWLSNIHTNFLIEIILVFVGTAALGCCIVFLVSLLIRTLRRGK
jgi:ABC-type transport system involved in cytochrome c biogenesis permease component